MSELESPSDQTPDAPGPKVRFAKLASGGFSAQQQGISELIRPTYRYKGRQDVILASVAAYSVQPDPEFARHAMRIACFDLYTKHCEAIALSSGKPASETTPKKKPAWSVDDLRRFRANVYEKLGGAKISGEICKQEFKRELLDLRDGLAQVHQVMEIWHVLVSDSAFGERKRRLNVELGCELASNIGYINSSGKRVTPSARTFERAWERFHKSIALSYAAVGLHIPKRGTLLDLILELKLTGSVVRPHLHAWLGRARFVQQHILSQLAPGNSPRRFVDLSKLSVDEITIPTPNLTKSGMVALKSAYL